MWHCDTMVGFGLIDALISPFGVMVQVHVELFCEYTSEISLCREITFKHRIG
jgi:hypothetical protein